MDAPYEWALPLATVDTESNQRSSMSQTGAQNPPHLLPHWGCVIEVT
jgi:hypothetical protein